MKPHDNPISTREKIQDVLDFLWSEKVFLAPNSPYTKIEMIHWCESWIEIYDTRSKSASKKPV